MFLKCMACFRRHFLLNRPCTTLRAVTGCKLCPALRKLGGGWKQATAASCRKLARPSDSPTKLSLPLLSLSLLPRTLRPPTSSLVCLLSTSSCTPAPRFKPASMAPKKAVAEKKVFLGRPSNNLQVSASHRMGLGGWVCAHVWAWCGVRGRLASLVSGSLGWAGRGEGGMGGGLMGCVCVGGCRSA